MDSNYLSDIDELALRCRTNSARKYIQEAVGCYKSGAFRGCIVMTWIAVVYDFVDKLRALDISGDKKASQTLAELAKSHGLENVERALKFERDLLDRAKNDFELISDLEFVDLKRLQEDRHRCAHPAFLETGEPYQPTAELARVHLRNAVGHFLQRPPVQGKAALDRLLAAVDSEFFPRSRTEAVSSFSHGPLAHPRETLTRNFLIAILKKLLLQGDTDNSHDRYLAALGAAIQLHRAVAEATLSEKLNTILSGVGDDRLSTVITLLDEVPELGFFLREDVLIRLKNYVSGMDVKQAPRSFNRAGRIGPLQTVVEGREARLSYTDLAAVMRADPAMVRCQVITRAVELYQRASYWDMANELGLAIAMVAARLSPDETEKVLRAAENRNVLTSFKFETVVLAIRSAKVLTNERIDTILRECGIDQSRPELMQDAVEQVKSSSAAI